MKTTFSRETQNRIDNVKRSELNSRELKAFDSIFNISANESANIMLDYIEQFDVNGITISPLLLEELLDYELVIKLAPRSSTLQRVLEHKELISNELTYEEKVNYLSASLKIIALEVKLDYLEN